MPGCGDLGEHRASIIGKPSQPLLPQPVPDRPDIMQGVLIGGVCVVGKEVRGVTELTGAL